jgi:hypothetical protein
MESFARDRGLRGVGTPAFVTVAGVLVAFRLFAIYPWNEYVFDLHAYWATRVGLDYALADPGPAGTYLYSPAFAQLIAPLTALPLPIFGAIWTAIGAAFLYWLVGRWSIVVALLPPVALTIAQGQLDLAYAVVILVGFRWPSAWALPILTKVTPGLGLLWFAVRREWRSLAIAGATTVAIVAVSAAIDPGSWTGWFGMLARMQFPAATSGLVLVPIPLFVRLPIAAAIVAWGAVRDRRWALPVGVCLAMPILWLNAFTILVAILPLLPVAVDSPAARFLRAARGTARIPADVDGDADLESQRGVRPDPRRTVVPSS